MYKYIVGKVTDIFNDEIILEKDGLAYEIFVSKPYKFIVDEEVKIYLYDLIKEDRFFLYGFLEEIEIELFKKMISINGIGPKKAINILNNFTCTELVDCVSNSDIKTFRKYSSLGTLSERIMLELSKKFNLLHIENRGKFYNVIKTLRAIGFSEKEIDCSIKLVPDNLSEEEVLKKCIRIIKNGNKE